MKSGIRLFAVYYRQGCNQHLLIRMLAPNQETAIRQARDLFKAKLSRMSGIELVSAESLPLERAVLKAKDPA